MSKPASQKLLVPAFYSPEDGGTLLDTSSCNKLVRQHRKHTNTHYSIHNILTTFIHACEQTPAPSMTAMKIKCWSLGVLWAYCYPQAYKEHPNLLFIY